MRPERSDGYHFLAEALSEPPDWLALPGRDWPLTQVMAAACGGAGGASNDVQAGLQSALRALESVPPGSLEERRTRYQALLSSPGSSELWMNEAGALTGRMLGDATWDVARWYQAAGLEISGAEQPDDIVLELAFLSYLSASVAAEIRQNEQVFLQQHALRWMPQLGSRLVALCDPVYAPVGQALSAWLAFAQDGEAQVTPFGGEGSQPAVRSCRPSVSPACSLCMGCVAACSREALRVQENSQTTRLVLLADACNGCGQCAAACPQAALCMQDPPIPAGHGWQVLFASPRQLCIRCGAPLVSQAELQYVSQILNHPDWLAVCPDCR